MFLNIEENLKWSDGRIVFAEKRNKILYLLKK